MKHILLYILFGSLNYGAIAQIAEAQSTTAAQSSEYFQTMTDVVADIQSTPFGQDLIPFANTMERIATAEPKEWLPPYWGAFCYMIKSFTEPVNEKKDQMLERAEKLVATADALSPNNDEIEVLKANIATARMAVDPQNRWMTYGPVSGAAIAKAKSLNPLNPRVTLHEAQTVFYTPEAYGGGKDKALPLIKNAVELFAAFKPASPIMPNWGADAAQMMLSEAKK
jgi:hypothetical protein